MNPAGAPAIWSEEKGPVDAPLVALVHGSMDRSAGMLRLSRRLDGAHRVLRYDRRGYGRSPHPGPFGIDDQVADLVDLLAGRRAVVFGHSYGGDVALALAAGHPDLVRAVAVYEVPLSWLDWWPQTTVDAAALADPAAAAEQFIRRMIGDDHWERLPAGTRRARRAEGRAMVGELVDLRARAAWSPDAIAVPSVAMHGTLGAARHIASSRYLGDVLADCKVVAIEGARHLGPNTHAGPVADAVAELVSRAATSP